MTDKNVIANVVVSCLDLLIFGNFNAIVTYESVAYKKKMILRYQLSGKMTPYLKRNMENVFYTSPFILKYYLYVSISVRLGGKKLT